MCLVFYVLADYFFARAKVQHLIQNTKLLLPMIIWETEKVLQMM